jgi:hypothetical protein
MILYRTKYYGVADSVRKAKSEYLDKLFKEAKEKIKDTELAKKRLRNNEEWEKCLDDEWDVIKEHYKNETKRLISKGDELQKERNLRMRNTRPDESVRKEFFNKYAKLAEDNGISIIIDPTIKDPFCRGTELHLKSNKGTAIAHEIEHAFQNKNGELLSRKGANFGIVRSLRENDDATPLMKVLYNRDQLPLDYLKGVVAREDGAITANTKRLYLDPKIPLDFVEASEHTPYKLWTRAPLGDTDTNRNYADLLSKNWIDPELYSKIKENAKKIGIDLEKKSKVNRTQGTPDVIERVKKWNLEKFGHSNIN